MHINQKAKKLARHEQIRAALIFLPVQYGTFPRGEFQSKKKHWFPNRFGGASNQNRPNPTNSPPSISPSEVTKEHVAMDTTLRQNPIVKMMAAMTKKRKLFLLYLKHAMIGDNILAIGRI